MTKASHQVHPKWLSWVHKTVVIAALGLAASSGTLAAPLAGTSIGNQAAATYTDASAIVRTTTSNSVSTTVQQVASLLLVNTQTVTAAPGQPVSLAHTLTNTGNGTDTFNLTSTLTPGTALLSAVTYFPDANCDGVADSGSPAITAVGPLVAGAKTCFVAVTSVGTTASSGGTGNNIVTATSAYSASVSAANTDTVNVSTNGVIGVTKSAAIATATGGRTGVDITYTLSYTNTGNAIATDVVLSDVVPTGATYVAASGKWNGVAIADGGAAAGVPTAGTITYDYNLTTPGNKAVTARVGSVATNSSGTLSFMVNVPAGTLPGTINNTARFCYNNGAALVPLGYTPSSCVTSGNPTNTVPYLVGATYGAIATDYFQLPNLQGAAATVPTASSTTDLGGVKDDSVTVAAAPQGATITFDNVIANTGTASDTFNIASAASTFPSGTTFLLFKADGMTPLTDSNGDGIVDTGPLAPGAVYHVFVKAILPAGVSTGGPFNVTITASSVGNPAVSDTVTDSLTAITANSVDLTNNSAGAAAPGAGVFPTAAAGVAANSGVAVTTNAVNPGATTTFTLVVNNTSAIADNYGVTVDQSVAGTTLPVGWAVNFYSTATPLSCATLGAPLVNTGAILAGANLTVCAVVTVPATQAAIPAPGRNIVFKVASPSTGAIDFKLDAVIVNTVRSISLSPNNASQVYPGGSVVYTHTLANTGNVSESLLAVASAMSGATTSWGNVVYADTNANGILDAADLALAAVTLAPGASITLFNKVLSPGSAAAGAVNTVLLTATQPNAALINGVAAPVPTTAQDVTTVIAGQVSLAKLQFVDPTCSLAAAPLYTIAPLTAKPGECVLYQITATNVGTVAATSLVIGDATPSNTTYNCRTAPATPAGGVAVVALTGGGAATPSAPASCAAGSISSGTIATLAPGASAVLTFGIQINP